MKIIILTQYFPPEIGAPQNRLHEIAVRMRRMGCEVEVMTAMPNYPQMRIHDEYKGKLYVEDEMDDLKVHRSWIYVSDSKAVMQRLLNYFSFVFSSLIFGILKLKRSDILICESPPLFLGISGWILARIKRCKFVFNVSDLWPESAEKLGIVNNPMFIKAAVKLEEGLYERSALITGQTQGIVNNIHTRFPLHQVEWLPNGVDLEYYDPDKYENSPWRSESGLKKEDFVLLYAGIVGYAQGLEVILEAANKLNTENFSNLKFVILGSGPERNKLIKLKEELGLKNVIFLDAVKKDKMPWILSSVDATLVPLRRLDLFKGAIPSKIFESLAMKKPIILGVDGEAKKLFIDNGKCGLFFEPENSLDLKNKIEEIYSNPILLDQLGENARAYVSENFSRNKIAQDFMNTLNAMNLN